MPTLDRTHFAPVTRPATDLTGTQALRGWISFPASGGVQVVDQNGVVTNIAGSSGGGVALLAATQTFTGVNTFAPAAASGITAGSESPQFIVDLAATRTWIAGPIPFQAAVTISAASYSASGASTMTDAVGLFVSAPAAVAPLTITNTYAILADGALGVDGGFFLSGTTTLNGTGTQTIAKTGGGLAFTATGGGISLTVAGTTTLSLNTGATGNLQLGGNAASKIGFFGTTPAVQGLAIADLGAFTDPPSAAEMATLRTTVNSILTRLRTPGFIAT